MDDFPEVEFENTVADLAALRTYGVCWWSPLVFVLATLGCTLPGALFVAWYGHGVTALVASAGLVACGVWLVIRSWRALPQQQAKLLLRRKLTLTPEYVLHTTDASQGRWKWAFLRDVAEYEGFVLTGIDQGYWIIPPRAFATPEARERFLTELQTRRRDARPPQGDEPILKSADQGLRDAIQIEYRNSPQIIRAAMVWARTGNSQQASGAHQGPWILAIALLVCWYGVVNFAAGEPIGYLASAAFQIATTIGMAVLVTDWTSRWSLSRDWRSNLPTRSTVTPEGFRMTTSQYDTLAHWERYEAVENDAQYIYIVYVKGTAQVSAIPKAAFASIADSERFYAHAREYLERAKGQTVGNSTGGSTDKETPSRSPLETGNPYQAPGG